MPRRKLKPFFQFNINSIRSGRDVNCSVKKTVGKTFYYFKPYGFFLRKIYFEGPFYIGKSPVIIKYYVSFMVDIPLIYSNRKIHVVAFRGIINRIMCCHPDPGSSWFAMLIKNQNSN